MGLCPLHDDHRPSFLVDPRKSLFYCYGCGRGGDVIRFAELYHQVRFPQALSLLHQWRGLAPLLDEATSFYRMQLDRHSEAIVYLDQRGVRSPELIEHMRIGYAVLSGNWIGVSGDSVIVVKHSAETARASNGPMLSGGESPRNDEQIADALVISLGVIVRDEFADGGSQAFLSEQDRPV